MTRAVYSGSFDPMTLGHLDIVRRAVKFFDGVIIAIGVNEKKTPKFDVAQRIALWQQAIHDDPELNAAKDRIIIGQTNGLIAEFAKANNATAIVRGVRTAADFESETTMALLNKQLTGVETVLLIADPNLGHISSSAVKEIVAFGGDVSGMVPDAVARALAAGV